MPRWSKVALLAAAVGLMLAACAGGNSDYGFKFYGNFCGPSHPRLTSKTRPDKLKELAAIEPIDQLDAACKRHDMCYAAIALGSLHCDNLLMSDLSGRHWTNPYCGVLASRMSTGILYGTTWSEIHPEDGWTTPNVVNGLKAPARQGMLGFIRAIGAPYMGLSLAVHEAEYRAAGSPPFVEGTCAQTMWISEQARQFHMQNRAGIDAHTAEIMRGNRP